MTSRFRITGRIAIWTAAATLGVGAIAGVALAATGATAATPSSTPNASASSAPHAKGHAKGHDKGKHHGMLAAAKHVLHGEFVVKGKDGKYVTIDSQRGSVTAVSPTSITLRSADGFTGTYVVTGDTKIRKDGKKVAIGDVKVGDPALLLAVKSATDKTAKGLVIGAPKEKTAAQN